MSSDQPRLNDQDLQEYWEALDARHGSTRTDADPEGLTHSVDSRRPTWFNQAYARLQERVFAQLLRAAEASAPAGRALDVGTGTGRWARVLLSHGYAVSAFDLGANVIAENRRRMPEIDWRVSSLEEFSAPDPYDLVSCVEVISYGSLDDQQRAAAALRSFARPGGHLVLLESIRYQSALVHSRPVAEWIDVFGKAGFSLVTVRPFNFLLGTRTVQRLLPWTSFRPSVEEGGALDSRPMQYTRTAGQAVGLGVDVLTEPMFLAARRPSFATRAGFLFRADRGPS